MEIRKEDWQLNFPPTRADVDSKPSRVTSRINNNNRSTKLKSFILFFKQTLSQKKRYPWLNSKSSRVLDLLKAMRMALRQAKSQHL